MMKKLSPYFLMLSICISIYTFIPKSLSSKDETTTINALLNDWHAAAGRADYKAYFDKISSDAHYMGTDANENWSTQAFAAFAKPHFNKGKAWNFKTLERHVFFSRDGKIAWFDELLDTQMKICRGSGVLEKEGKEWKIKHYVLSMTVPNDVSKEVIPLKAKYEDALIEKLRSSSNKHE